MKHRKLTYDVVIASSRRFTSRYEFQLGDKASYHKALKMGWIDSFVWLGLPTPHINDSESKVHCIYIYCDKENMVAYIGRTNNIATRHRQHNRRDYRNGKYDVVRRYFVESGLFSQLPEPIILEDKLTASESQEREDFYIRQYRNIGWRMLNSGKTGANISSLGSYIIKWNYDSCHNIALTCKTRKEFEKKNASAYSMAKSRGWIDDWLPISSHFHPKQVDWTEELCKQIAEKYVFLKDFHQNDPLAYNAASKHGWLKNFTWLQSKKNIKITEDEIRILAKNFQYKIDFKTAHPSHYAVARKLGVINELGFIPKSKTKWTFDSCKTEAMKYTSQIEFRRSNFSAYEVSRKNGWLDAWLPKTRIIKTDDELLTEASKFHSIKELRKYSNTLYCAILRRGLLTKSGLLYSVQIWNDELVILEASKYQNRTAFRKGSKGAYDYALKHKLLDKLF